jgi:hypothetical protein
MTANSKNANVRKTMAWAAALIVFGLLALIGGTKTLVLLLPAAAFVWYQSRPIVHSGRN